MIRLEEVRKTYRRADGSVFSALDVPSLHVAAGEAVCVVGGSGTGKTTLLNVVAGIVRPDAGRVEVDGVDVTSLGEARRDLFRARRIGYVFQTFNLLQAYTAEENVLLPLRFAGVPRGEARSRAAELLSRVGLGAKRAQKPAAMSVGEQQRVAVARAVACRPKVLLADEPTASLDPANAAEAMRLLRDVAAEVGAVLLLVTHDQRLRGEFARVETLGAARKEAAS
ncbi:MAG TPA: ABC transporter ATP-binding protein [Planctomycetota bacterium]|nr:ABC transporter ATP-binding protein [Planctomycetota bacterium]